MPIVFTCTVCSQALSAEDNQAGTQVRCSQCMSVVMVPKMLAPKPVVAVAPRSASSSGAVPPPVGATFGRPRPTRRAVGRRYGFNCGYCSSRLEAVESSAGEDGTCPTCGSTITIPILGRNGQLYDPKTREIIKQDPHPVHTYAAAGERAPKIIRTTDGKQSIQCARCGTYSSITANNCRSCGMPFTMEGTTVEAAGTSNGFCTSALICGVIGIPLSVIACTSILPVLAVVFGIIGCYQTSGNQATGSGRWQAVTGICLGSIGVLLAVWRLMH